MTIVQNAVNRLIIGRAPLLSLDGVYGPATEAAIRQLQHHAPLLADGIVGAATKRVLDLT